MDGGRRANVLNNLSINRMPGHVRILGKARNDLFWVQFSVSDLIQQPTSTQPLADEHEQVHPAPSEVQREHDGGPQHERGQRHRHRSDWQSPESDFHRR